jgi:hypothetical protein
MWILFFIVGPISSEVTGFLNLPNSSSCTMTLGLTQSLTEMHIRNLTGGKRVKSEYQSMYLQQSLSPWHAQLTTLQGTACVLSLLIGAMSAEQQTELLRQRQWMLARVTEGQKIWAVAPYKQCRATILLFLWEYECAWSHVSYISKNTYLANRFLHKIISFCTFVIDALVPWNLMWLQVVFLHVINYFCGWIILK